MAIEFLVKSLGGSFEGIGGDPVSRVHFFKNQDEGIDPAVSSGGFALLFWGDGFTGNEVTITLAPVDRFGIPYQDGEISFSFNQLTNVILGNDGGYFQEFNLPKCWGVKLTVDYFSGLNNNFYYEILY